MAETKKTTTAKTAPKEKEQNEEKKDFSETAKETVDKIMDTPDETKKYTKKEIEDGKGMAVLSYLLPFIPYFAEKENKFVKYHAAQGMNLLVIAIIYGIINAILTSIIKVTTTCSLLVGFNYICKVTPWWVTLPLGIIGVLIGILCVIGIVYACQGKAKELPFVNKLKLFK